MSLVFMSHTATSKFNELHVDFRKARGAMAPTSMRSVRGTAHRIEPGTGLDAVIGQADAVRLLREAVVKPLKSWQHLTFTSDPPMILVISGQPGGGKTFLATQLVAELGWHLFSASPADLLASRVGQAEKQTARLCAAARRCAPSCVVLEDLETLLPAEGSEGRRCGGCGDLWSL